nr:TPA_asm: gasderminX [Larimichthys croaker adintovirus]
MSARIRRNAPLLKALYHATPRKRKDILAHSSPDFLQALCEIALNLLKGNIPLSSPQYKKLKSRRKIIRLLADKKTALNQKRRTLMKQSGGFILPLLSAAVPILGNLIGGLVNRR